MDIATELIISNKLQFEEGEIKLFGTSIFLIPPEVYMFLYSELDKTGQTDIFYKTCQASAFELFTNLIKSSHKDIDELIAFVPKILNLLAYGKVSITKKDLSNMVFEFSLESPLYPEIFGKYQKPIDVAFAGLLAGSLSAVLKTPMRCIEKECVSTGFGNCTFVAEMGVL
ncbi:MAG: hypothetical protein FJY86_01410 [Candidatus Diapherotrites archaeon]|uniref:4-vinyl reductase 4VR domain-containing protein n=1 Tax=Candidatus Iainarchaeum sp. TaxID=3101447 RepID=A0A8T4C674_9ARCH|nr:hypothetical protein [Candidatus Diapherotrites archaeon]